MQWSIDAYLFELCAASNFGDKIVDEVAAYIAQENPCVKVFNCRGLYRMKQFYETYKDDGFVTPLATQISWTNHLLIMSGSKTVEERRFYMALCAKVHYSQNVFSIYPTKEMLTRREIDAQKYLIAVAERDKIPAEETEVTRRNLEMYEECLKELVVGRNEEHEQQ